MSIKWMEYGWSTDHPALLNSTHLLVWLVLADFANDEGTCWPTIGTVARKARTSERTVSRVLNQFENWNLIERNYRYKDSTVYRLRAPKLWGDKLSGQELPTRLLG